MSLQVKRFQGLPAVPRYCSDCETEHIGQVPCGMTWLQRMRSTVLDTEATPSRSRRDYFDDEPLKGIFGADKRERKEEVMEETKGIGALSRRDPMTPEAAKVFFGDD